MIDNPPRHAPRLSPSYVVAWAVFALGTFIMLGTAAQMLQLAWGMWFSEIIILLGLAFVGYQLVGFEPRRALGLRPFNAQSFGVGFAFGVVNYVAWAVPLMALAQALFPKVVALVKALFPNLMTHDWTVDQFDSSRIFEHATTFELAVILLGVSIAAPLGEEAFFRGFLQRCLGEHRGAPRAIVVTAFIFSAFHLDPVGLAARFELGVLFGLLAWRAGSLWPAIAAHAANNIVSSLLYLSSAKEENMAWWVPLAMFLLGNLALVALVRWARGRLKVVQAEELVVQAWPRLGVIFLPWLAAGAASVLLLFAVDLRGVQLNLMEIQLQAPKSIKEREDVKELRARVRRGEVALQEYEALLKASQLK